MKLTKQEIIALLQKEHNQPFLDPTEYTTTPVDILITPNLAIKLVTPDEDEDDFHNLRVLKDTLSPQQIKVIFILTEPPTPAQLDIELNRLNYTPLLDNCVTNNNNTLFFIRNNKLVALKLAKFMMPDPSKISTAYWILES